MNNSLNVPAGTDQPIKLHLRAGSLVRGLVTSVKGGSGNDVVFGVLDAGELVQYHQQPSLAPTMGLSKIQSGYPFNFTSPIENDYFLTFDNHMSGVSSKAIQYHLIQTTPLTHSEIVRYQLNAIYDTIQANGLSYVNTPISYAPGDAQRVKRPSDTIRMKGGNCIDASVLFASCFEAISLDAYLILLTRIGHAIVAVRSWPDSQDFVFIECTVASSSSFDESRRVGNQTYQKEKDNATWVSISDARKKRIMPLT